jgi:hypothetical protein
MIPYRFRIACLHASNDNIPEDNPLNFSISFTVDEYSPWPVPANEVVTPAWPEGSAFVSQDGSDCLQSCVSPFFAKLLGTLLAVYPRLVPDLEFTYPSPGKEPRP